MPKDDFSVVNFSANYSRGTGAQHKGDRTDYKDRFNCTPNCNNRDGGPPYFSVIIFVTCWIFFFMYNLGDNSFEVQNNLTNSPYIYKADLVANFSQPWRYFTYSFLHADLEHIISNMVIFMLVCPLLELAHDSLRPALVYIVGVILGSLLAGIWSPDSYLVGASGGCYAVVLAHIANIIMNCGEMDKKWLTIRLVVLAPLVFAAVFDVYKAYVRYFTEFGGSSGVSYAAHVGGTITGLFFGSVILRNYHEKAYEKWIQVLFFVLFGGVFVYAIAMTLMGWYA